jgi:drug/metabolite transporter (DMT)-like permease
VDYVIVLTAAVLLGIGFVLQQHAAAEAPKSHFLTPRLVIDLLRKRVWLLGMVCMVAGQGLSAWALGRVELSFFEPLLTTNLLFALLLAVPLSGQMVRVTEVAGALLLIAGEAMLSLGRFAWPVGMSFGSPGHWPAAAAIALIAFLAVRAGRRYQGTTRATLTGVGAGLLFGIQDALTRQSLEILQNNTFMVLLTRWPVYCLIATAAIGIWLMESAFNAGPLHASLATITAGEPVTGIILGILVFGDRIQLTPGSLVMEAGGIVALVLGVAGVARAPALTGLRKAVDHAAHAHDGERDHAVGGDRVSGDGAAGRRARTGGALGRGIPGHSGSDGGAADRGTASYQTGHGGAGYGGRGEQPGSGAALRRIPGDSAEG